VLAASAEAAPSATDSLYGSTILSELPKPKLDLDPDAPSKYRLTFDVPWVIGLWRDTFEGEAGGHEWPSYLPRPHYQNARIEARGLEYGQLQTCIESLRKRFESTDREIERQRPEREARDRGAAADAARREEEFADAKRLIDELFD
jgi:hypothetical protein